MIMEQQYILALSHNTLVKGSRKLELTARITNVVLYSSKLGLAAGV